MGIFQMVIGGLIVVALFVVVWAVVHVEQMSDEDREAISHGPKGQGR
ncbi:MAG: hypothetical protein JXK93_14085 [Sphaerochaetaceae bacterium]|nr:hypothetical protein [Sphaerochaetaceae bacterium]